ncbi:MAG TPA: hypothetical protein VK983_03200, partial [Candidatus Limnocylindrales bacterium]|nr:hypothetical protein [Candidatus Limnocylindrales bacterium]
MARAEDFRQQYSGIVSKVDERLREEAVIRISQEQAARLAEEKRQEAKRLAEQEEQVRHTELENAKQKITHMAIEAAGLLSAAQIKPDIEVVHRSNHRASEQSSNSRGGGLFSGWLTRASEPKSVEIITDKGWEISKITHPTLIGYGKPVQMDPGTSSFDPDSMLPQTTRDPIEGIADDKVCISEKGIFFVTIPYKTRRVDRSCYPDDQIYEINQTGPLKVPDFKADYSLDSKMNFDTVAEHIVETLKNNDII